MEPAARFYKMFGTQLRVQHDCDTRKIIEVEMVPTEKVKIGSLVKSHVQQ